MKTFWLCLSLSFLAFLGCQRAEAPVDATAPADSSAEPASAAVTPNVQAKTVLDEALTKAKAANKNVFIHFKTDT